MEIWKMIKNSSRHAVSNKGRVIRYVGDDSPCLSESMLNWKEIKPHFSDGYAKVQIDIFGKNTTKLVHRLVIEAFIGESDSEVNHKDCNRSNNNLENLEWVSRSENIKHAYMNGRLFDEGNERRGRKLVSSDIDKIKELHKSGYTHQKIASLYNVSRVLITKVLNNKSWVQ
jgi:hypothetical protein